jgi:hypothetical protein
MDLHEGLKFVLRVMLVQHVSHKGAESACADQIMIAKTTYRDQELNIPPSHRNVRRHHKLTLIPWSLKYTIEITAST